MNKAFVAIKSKAFCSRLAKPLRGLALALGCSLAASAGAQQQGCSGVPALQRVYVLGDSISHGLSQDGLISMLQSAYGSEVRISFDVGRSITSPGIQIKKTALESVEIDRDFIARAGAIVVVLGTNQIEASFDNSQQVLMWQLKALAPDARYFWVDIGATIANQVPGWTARNHTIYNNATVLGYEVISRYKAIFGPQADPLNISPGMNFPGWSTEPGYGAEGNLHGMNWALADAITTALGRLCPASRVSAPG